MSRRERFFFRNIVLCALLSGSVFASSAIASTTWTVDSIADTDDGSCTAGACTLRDAMKAAQPGDTIVFSTLFNSPQTIAIGTALPAINGNLTITGPGANQLTVRANDGGNYTISLVNNGTVSISELTFANGKGISGGAIKNAGTLTLTNVVLTGNGTSTSSGGGIQNIGALNIVGSTLEGNTAQFGGGIWNDTQPPFVGTLTVTSSTLSGNSATATGSAIVNIGFGGSTNTAALVNCTIADNSGGAAVADFDQGGSASLTTRNTIFSNNGTTFAVSGSNAHIVSLGNNLDSSDGGGNLGASGDLTNTDPRLLPLGYYGGRTPTYMPQLSSPAVNAGANVGASAFDQRGVARPQNGVADIGAVELRPLVVFSADDTGSGFCDSNCTLRDALTQADNDDGVVDDIFFSNSVFNTPQTVSLATALPNITGDVTINGPGANLLTVSPVTVGSFSIFLVNGGAVAAISGMTISGGANSFGGGIDSGGVLSLFGVVMTGNNATLTGGAIYSGGPLFITDSTISSNNAGYCTALAATGNAVITNSTIADNVSANTGIVCNLNGGGPAITLTLNNDTVARNASVGGDAGVGTYDQGGPATTYIQNTIVADSKGAPNLHVSGANGHMVSLGNNLCSDDGAGLLVASGDLINTEPLLGTLSNYGGSTLTLYPKRGSPAIDAGNDGAAPATDQRGISRPQGVHVDIGAVEANGDLIFQDGFDG